MRASISRLFSYAAWTDKYEGQVHRPPMRGAVLAMPEAIGVIGIACPDEYPSAGLYLTGRARAGYGEYRCSYPFTAITLERDGLLSSARNLRRTRRSRQYCYW